MGITAQEFLQALSAQLVAEISASEYRSIRRVAQELDVDYTTLYKKVTGKGAATIRMETIYSVLTLIGVPPDIFFTRVQERAESGHQTD
jgi:hypothetical protein